MKKLLFGLIAGVSAGLLFAPKSGKKLREQLKKSDAKFADFGHAVMDAAKDAGDEVQELVESEDMKKMLTSGKKGVDDFVKLVEEKGGELSKKARMEFDGLLDDAMTTAEQAKKEIEKKAKAVKKTVKKKATTAKKVATKKVAAAKKTATKKATAVKKTATKKATAAKKTVAKKATAAKKKATKTVKKVTKK